MTTDTPSLSSSKLGSSWEHLNQLSSSFEGSQLEGSQSLEGQSYSYCLQGDYVEEPGGRRLGSLDDVKGKVKMTQLEIRSLLAFEALVDEELCFPNLRRISIESLSSEENIKKADVIELALKLFQTCPSLQSFVCKMPDGTRVTSDDVLENLDLTGIDIDQSTVIDLSSVIELQALIYKMESKDINFSGLQRLHVELSELESKAAKSLTMGEGIYATRDKVIRLAERFFDQYPQLQHFECKMPNDALITGDTVISESSWKKISHLDGVERNTDLTQIQITSFAAFDALLGYVGDEVRFPSLQKLVVKASNANPNLSREEVIEAALEFLDEHPRLESFDCEMPDGTTHIKKDEVLSVRNIWAYENRALTGITLTALFVILIQQGIVKQIERKKDQALGEIEKVTRQSLDDVDRRLDVLKREEEENVKKITEVGQAALAEIQKQVNELDRKKQENLREIEAAKEAAIAEIKRVQEVVVEQPLEPLNHPQGPEVRVSQQQSSGSAWKRQIQNIPPWAFRTWRKFQKQRIRISPPNLDLQKRVALLTSRLPGGTQVSAWCLNQAGQLLEAVGKLGIRQKATMFMRIVNRKTSWKTKVALVATPVIAFSGWFFMSSPTQPEPDPSFWHRYIAR